MARRPAASPGQRPALKSCIKRHPPKRINANLKRNAELLKETKAFK